MSQSNNGFPRVQYQQKKDHLQWLVTEIEKHYRSACENKLEQLKQDEEREKSLESLRKKLVNMKSENEDLQEQMREWSHKNQELSQQLEEAEREGQYQMQSIQQFGSKKGALQTLKKEIQNKSIYKEASEEMLQIIESTNKQLKSSIKEKEEKIKLDQQELIDAKEKLHQTQEKLQKIQYSNKNVKELQTSLEKEKIKVNAEVNNLQIQNTELLSQINDLQSSYVSIKKEWKKDQAETVLPLSSYNLEELAHTISPKGSKEQLDQRRFKKRSESSQKTFNIFESNQQAFPLDKDQDKEKYKDLAQENESNQQNEYFARQADLNNFYMKEEKNEGEKKVSIEPLYFDDSESVSLKYQNAQSPFKMKIFTHQGIETNRQSLEALESMEEKIKQSLIQYGSPQQFRQRSHSQYSYKSSTTSKRQNQYFLNPFDSLRNKDDSQDANFKEAEEEQSSVQKFGQMIMWAGVVAATSFVYYTVEKKK